MPETQPFSKYSFTYSYNNGQGDSYKGYFYSPTGYNGYKVGYTKTVTDENKQTGSYRITAAQDIGTDSSKSGQVFVTQYYDGDQTKKRFTPLNYTSPLGTKFLGSEVGYIKNADVKVYKFGKGYYEADAGDTYTFRYTYGFHGVIGKGSDPKINDRGQILWGGYDGNDDEIYLYEHGVVKQITNNTNGDYESQINNNGQIVWYGYDGNDHEIFLYDNGVIKQITDNAYDDYDPQINASGLIVWQDLTGTMMKSIFITME